MEEFLNIDWNPSLEDMIDTKFVDPERLRKDSAMYRILRGTFNDPFEGISEDYEDLVTSEMMDVVNAENIAKKEQEKIKRRATTKVEPETDVPGRERTAYVPGLVKCNIIFPRISNLYTDQQESCLRVLLRFSGSRKPEVSAANNAELKLYMNLLPKISKEQEEFLEFAKQQWDASKFEIHEEEYINEQWKKKIKLIDSLPRYYAETGSIPFVSSKEIGVNYHSTCLEMGKLPKAFLPKLTKRFILPANTTKINQRYFADNVTGESQSRVIFKKSVSQDLNCDKLARDHDVDMVISSAGLNCLAVNMDPRNTIWWNLPIVVKRINDKNVVFVDKPLPPTGRTVMQKNAWFYKYSLKSFIIHPHHSKALSLDENDTETLARRRQLRHWDSAESIDCSKSPEDSSQNKEPAIDSREDDKSEERNDEFLRPPADHNLFYRLFSIGPCGEPQNELMKNRVEKVYKLLVRTKSDGVVTTDGEEELTIIAPKLEHQLVLGAEAVTSEEASKQWMSLTFRPNTCLSRVRIDATTSEAIQIEKRYPNSVNNEIKRLYNLKTEAALALLYNVTETMTAMNPGRYLIRHTVRTGAFASVYKEVESPGKNVLDLQTVYCEKDFRTIPNPPWPMLDKNVVTPTQKFFKRMPALFRPRTKANAGGKKFKKGKKQQGSKPDGLRKSARKKGSPSK